MTVYSASDPIFRRDPRKFRLRGGGASVTIGEKNRPDDLELVKAIREGEAWSLADMGQRLKVTRAHVAAIENGKAVSPARAVRYARALGYGEEQFIRLAIQDGLTRAGRLVNV